MLLLPESPDASLPIKLLAWYVCARKRNFCFSERIDNKHMVLKSLFFFHEILNAVHVTTR